ncbi:MAG: restriction endonuclease subunit S [Bacteroidota bacterium]
MPKLADIANIATGYSFRSKLDHDPRGDTKVIQMSDVGKRKGIDTEGLVSIADFSPRSDRYFLEAGDVLMTSRGHNLHAYLVPEGLGRVVPINSFLIIKCDKNKVLPDYLVWYLNSDRMQYNIHVLAGGTNIPSLPKKSLESMDVFLPSIQKQETLAKIESLKKQEIGLLRELASKKESFIDTVLEGKLREWKSSIQ